MKNSILPLPSQFFPVALALLALNEGALEAWPYFKLPGETTICCAPQDREAAPTEPESLTAEPESLTELSSTDAPPAQFSQRWRLQIKDIPTSFELQWTQDYYLGRRQDTLDVLKPIKTYHNVLQKIPFPEGNVASWQERYGRCSRNVPNSRQCVQFIILPDNEVELSFDAFAGTGGTDELFAVKLYGAQWLCPWDDRQDPPVRSLPDGSLLRRASSAADLRKIRLTTLYTFPQREDSTQEEPKFSCFVVEIQGPGINSGDRTQYGSLLCVFLTLIPLDAPSVQQEVAKQGITTRNLDTLNDWLAHAPELYGIQVPDGDQSGPDDAHSDADDPDPDPSAGPNRDVRARAARSESESSPDEALHRQDLDTIRRLNEKAARLTADVQRLQAANEGLQNEIQSINKRRDRTVDMLNEERVTFGAEIQNLRRENEGLREQVAARQAELGALRAQAQRNAATAQAEQARLAAEVQRIRTQIQSGSTEPDPSAGSGPQTLQDEIKALKEQAEKLQDSLAVAQSWRLCLNFQRAVAVIRKKVPGEDGKRLVTKAEYQALSDSYKQFTDFLTRKRQNILQVRRQRFSFTPTDLGRVVSTLFEAFEYPMAIHFACIPGESKPPGPCPFSEDYLNKLNAALEQFLTKLQEVGGVDMRDMGEPTGD